MTERAASYQLPGPAEVVTIRERGPVRACRWQPGVDVPRDLAKVLVVTTRPEDRRLVFARPSVAPEAVRALVVRDASGRTNLEVRPGDWIVRNALGLVEVFPDGLFSERFEVLRA